MGSWWWRLTGIPSKRILRWAVPHRRAVLVLLLGLCANSCKEMAARVLCDDDVLLEARSPSNQRVAFIKTRNCGATSSNIMTIGITEKYQGVFSSTSYVFVGTGSWRIAPKWKTDTMLEVELRAPPNGRILEKLESVGAVSVRYTDNTR